MIKLIYTINAIGRKILPQFALNYLNKMRDKKQLDQWIIRGFPIPPPHIVKQTIIAEYQEESGYNILIETGTYLGDMVEAQKTRFKKIVSIELAIELFKKAQKRFKNDKNVLIVQGDSGKELGEVLKTIYEPAIFWLDGHYSEGFTAKGFKECPIFEELDSIFNAASFNHILLIDDAKDFTGNGDYPKIAEITDYIMSKNPKYEVEVKHNIIRYVI